MNFVKHAVTLVADERFGGRLPPHEIGLLLAELPGAVRYATSMAFRNRSTQRGKRPPWLERAADIRLVDFDSSEQTTLYFEAPRLGDAAAELYRHGELWPSRPDSQDTAVDLFTDVVAEVAANNADSERYDLPLLKRVVGFRRVLAGHFQAVRIEGQHVFDEGAAALTCDVIRIAERFTNNTPPPKRLRLVGMLDMVRASTQTFGLKLQSGEEVRGVLLQGAIEELAKLLNQKVLVFGKAVYRASGRLLRIDSDEFRLASDHDEFFARLPKPPRAKLDLKSIFREQQSKQGVKAILGKWPGDESDEEIARALQEIS